MPSRSMFAILLCAGYGTRMGSLTRQTPKPLLPVAGRPMVDYLMDQMAQLGGIDGVHVVTNALDFPKLESWAQGWRRRVEIRLHDDGTRVERDRLGSVGDLAFVLARTEIPDGALVAGTDNIFRFPIEPLWRAFVDGDTSLVLALREQGHGADSRGSRRRKGVLQLGPHERVLGLQESTDRSSSPWTCPALYCLGRSALQKIHGYLDAGKPADELGTLIDYLASREPVRAFKATGQRLHVGSPEVLERANQILRKEPVLSDTPS